MNHSVVTQQLAEQLDQLPFELQRKVLDFARALALSLPKGTPGQQLLSFAGSIHPDDAQVMTQAIENGCERVEANLARIDEFALSCSVLACDTLCVS